jgi:hypothetical protein
MPLEATLISRLKLPDGKQPPSDPLSIPRGREYQLALRFNRRRPGLAAFDWVAVWRTSRGQDARAFPLDAHGFDEALQGAATTVLLETGYPVPKDEMELASYKVRRVNEYLRFLALQE